MTNYKPEQHITVELGGSIPKFGLNSAEVARLDAYIQSVAGSPIYEDKSRYPTEFSPKTYLRNGANVLVPGSHQKARVKGPRESVDAVVQELMEKVGLKKINHK